MHSVLATQLRRELVAATRRLTPEPRLKAFLVHNRLMAQLYEAGLHQRIKEWADRLGNSPPILPPDSAGE
jgi:hypothetical protein